MKKVVCKLIQVSPLSSDIYQLSLRPSEPLTHQPGQYVEVELGEFGKRPFSIANFGNDHILELHIRDHPDNHFTQAIMMLMQQKHELTIHGPMGHCVLQRNNHPIIMLANGTGFSPMKAMLEALDRHEMKNRVSLYWLVEKEDDLYWHQELIERSKTQPYFHYEPFVYTSQDFNGMHTDLVGEIARTHPLSDCCVYAAGHPDMVGFFRKALHENGLPLASILSDV